MFTRTSMLANVVRVCALFARSGRIYIPKQAKNIITKDFKQVLQESALVGNIKMPVASDIGGQPFQRHR